MEKSINDKGKFFERVWGSDQGTRIIATSVPGKDATFQNFAFDDNEGAAAFAAAEDTKGKNVYFGVHLFEGEGRKARNAIGCRALYLDIDCGEGKQYADKFEAVSAVKKMADDTGMPLPEIVDSGNGIHCYWFLPGPLSEDVWSVYAHQLDTLCKDQGLKADKVTTDKARVLRCPGTSNRKDPNDGDGKRCEILLPGTIHDPAEIKAILDKNTLAIPPDKASEINDPFMAGLDNSSEFSKAVARLSVRFITGDQVTEYDPWMKVGFAFWNTFEGSDEGLQLWDEVSKRSTNYKSGVCSEKWQTMVEYEGEKATAGTLHRMAKEAAGEDFLKEFRSEALIAKASEIGVDDMGNAQRLVMLHGENIRYDYARKIWYAWTGTHWKEDAEAEVMRLAKTTARNILIEAAKTEDDGRRKALVSWARTSASGVHLREMVRLATDEADIQATISDFDQHTNLLCVENGVVNLRTRKLLPHDRDLMLTRCLAIPYNPAAECPVFDAFLDRIFDGNSELIEYVLRALGYAITGENSEHVLFMCYGEGANGKSTLLETVQYVLGDLAGTVRTEALMQDKFGGNSGHNDDIANLHGKRFVAASEGESGQKLAESRIKQMTGGDTISASRKYGRAFQYQPIFALFFATNHKPQISGTDEGIWRRIRLLPFNVCIPEHERDPNLKAKLQSEAAGILTKLVRASSDWYAGGLGNEPDVAKATADYRNEQDTVASFLVEMCECEQGQTAVPAMLYSEYKQWCIDNGVDYLNRQAFPAELEKKGFRKRAMRWINNQTRTLWQGIRLRNAFASGD